MTGPLCSTLVAAGRSDKDTPTSNASLDPNPYTHVQPDLSVVSIQCIA